MAGKRNLQPLGIYSDIGSVTWKSNGTPALPLNREDEVKSYKLRLDITHNNGASPVMSVTDFFEVLSELRIVAGGRNNIKMVDGIKMYINYIKNFGVLPSFSFDTTASAAGLTSWLIVEIPMMMFDMKRPHDTIFPSYGFKNLDMKIQFSEATVAGTDVTITSGSVTIMEDVIEDYNRYISANQKEDFGYFKEIYQTKTITASNPKEPFVLPVDMNYKQLAFVSTIDGELSDAVINGVVIKSGTKVIRSYTADVLKAHMRRQIGGQITDADLKGILIVDFGERGHITEFLNTISAQGGFKQLTIELDVNSSAGVDVVRQYSDHLELIPND